MTRTNTFVAGVFLVLIALLLGGSWMYSRSLPAAPQPVTQAPVAQPKPTPTGTAQYLCDNDIVLKAAFYDQKGLEIVKPGQQPKPTGSVEVTFPDGKVQTYKQTVSADGGRYANDNESFVFWSKGNGAIVQEYGAEGRYTHCVAVAEDPGTLGKVYHSSTEPAFVIRYKDGFVLDTSYSHDIAPHHTTHGIRFTVDPRIATGTNLGSDTALSIEYASTTGLCTPSLFLSDTQARAATTTDGQAEYLIATSSDAAVGNRYSETVYTFPYSVPCTAVRYFIHSSAIENYPKGRVEPFDLAALSSEFDAMRRTLMFGN